MEGLDKRAPFTATGGIIPPEFQNIKTPCYILDEKAEKAQHFRIRHGECDRDTSLVISAMLTAKLREAGCEVDYHSPWNTPHAGDYDLDELFAWIDGICG